MRTFLFLLLLTLFPSRLVFPLSAELTLQFLLVDSFTPEQFQDDGNDVTDNYSFGVNTTNVLTAEVGDPLADHVRFEYSVPSGSWTVIGTDTDTSDTSYSVTWDITGLAARNDYRVRVVAVDSGSQDHPGVMFVNCRINL